MDGRHGVSLLPSDTRTIELETHESLEEFLGADDLIETFHPKIQTFAAELLDDADEIEAARRVFLFVRDEVDHSWDIRGTRVTRTASDVLHYREGICYSKSHLASAILRARGIPSGICYQRLTLLEDDSAGYAVHALNTVWLRAPARWIRFDARGNKPGVSAEFSIDDERLAFPIRREYDEISYSRNYARPHPRIRATLNANDNAIEMYLRNLPSALD